MLANLSVVNDSDRDVLENPEAAASFWEAVAPQDPLTAVRAVCDALTLVGRAPHIDRLHALFALDRHTQLLLERLLWRFAAISADLPALERQLRHAVFELSRAYAQGYVHYLRHIRDRRPGRAWRDAAPALLVRLYYHRQIELLLHLFRYEPWPRGRWRELHDAYRWVRQGATSASAVASPGRDRHATSGPETMYVRVLLTQLLDGGQFLPPELATARKWIVRWSRVCTLQPWAADRAGSVPAVGFVVDISGADGLKRPSMCDQGEWLWLDTTPIALAIERDLAAVRDIAPTTRACRLALLSRLKVLFAPKMTRIERRGERNAAALTSVEATIGGLGSIFSMLRSESRHLAESAPNAHHMATADAHGKAKSSSTGAPFEDSLSPFPATATFGVPQLSWQVRDRSHSGSRLRGRVSNPRRTVPGSLTAFRDDEHSAWMLAVIRRLKRLPGSNVEIGVEHLGRDPQPVVLMIERADASGVKRERFPAIYLHGGVANPTASVKTLVLPATQFEPGRIFTMISNGKQFSIRLKEAIEHQADFVWTLFEISDVRTPAVTAPRLVVA